MTCPSWGRRGGPVSPCPTPTAPCRTPASRPGPDRPGLTPLRSPRPPQCSALSFPSSCLQPDPRPRPQGPRAAPWGQSSPQARTHQEANLGQWRGKSLHLPGKREGPRLLRGPSLTTGPPAAWAPEVGHTHSAFAEGARVPFPLGAVRVGLPVRVGALGRAEPRLKFLYLQSQRVCGQSRGTVAPAVPGRPQGRCLGRAGTQATSLRPVGSSGWLLRQLRGVCPRAPRQRCPPRLGSEVPTPQEKGAVAGTRRQTQKQTEGRPPRAGRRSPADDGHQVTRCGSAPDKPGEEQADR